MELDAASESSGDSLDLDRQLHSALWPRLPELHRSALTLRYFEEMDYRTIENTLGLSNGALRGILGRALASMRKRTPPRSRFTRITMTIHDEIDELLAADLHGRAFGRRAQRAAHSSGRMRRLPKSFIRKQKS